MEPTIAIPSDLPVLPSWRLRWLALMVRSVLWLIGAVWLLFGLTWLVLHGWIVPRIGDYRPQLEAQASKALGVPVRIGHIAAQSTGMIPTFELLNVSLLDARGQEALRLPRVVGALSPTSLWGLGFEQLLIEQPELDVRRAANGRLFVGGLELPKDPASGHSDLADWFFSQTEFVLRGGTIRWSDETRQAPPLVLSQVDVVVRNGSHRHLMRLDATPPPEWGQRLSLRGMFRRSLLSVHAGDFNNWSGQLYADFSRVDVSRVKQYAGFDALGVELNQGQGALRAWADVSRGKFAGAVADVALRNVDARLGPKLSPLAFESISGRVAGRQRSDGFDASTEGLRFRTQSGIEWPGGNVALMHLNGSAGKPDYTTLSADKLDLAALAQIADRLPLDAKTQELITSFAPRGLVESIEAGWQGPLSAPVTYAAKGRVTGIGLAALPAAAVASAGRPGVSGAAIDFDITQGGGQAKLSIVNGALDLPGIFEETRLPLDRLSAELQWKLTGLKIELQMRNLEFANADAQGSAQVRWHTSEPVAAAAGQAAGVVGHDARFPGVLDLQGSLSRGQGSRVHRYLPLVLDEAARHYVRDAVLQGQASEVKFKVKGELDHLPFVNPAQGDFRISAKVKNAELAYVPKALLPASSALWPALTELNGELVFNRGGMEVNGATAKVAGLPGLQLVKGDATIADLAHNATVDVHLAIKGALTDALAFVNTSPVGTMTEQALAKATASGAADYRFHLTLPIHAIEKSRVEGSVTLAGNDLTFSPDAPVLEAIKGVVNLTERGFSVAGAQAKLLGGDVRIEGGSRPGTNAAGKASLAFKAQGTISAEALRRLPGQDLVAHMAQHATGSAAYLALLVVRRGIPEVTVSSTLQGMALNLPAPLNKAAESVLPLRFENALVPASLAPGQTLQDQLLLTVGRIASLSYLRDVSGPTARVIRGRLGVGLDANESVPAPEAGVGANIKLAEVDLDAWEKILTQGSASAQSAQAATPSSASTADAMGYLPTVMAIQAKKLLVQGRSLTDVVVGGTREGLNWRANVDAAELNGYLEYRQPGSNGAGRVFARLSRLSLAAGNASQVEAMLDEQPDSIPALDIVVDDMELRGRKLGRVEVDAVNRGSRPGAVAKEWHLNKFNVTMPEATLTATGDWVATGPPGAALGPRLTRAVSTPRHSVVNFRLDIADSGELLKRFGMDGVLRRGKGRMEGQLAWTGSPLSLDVPTLSGQLRVDVEAGQFIKADPGIAKLLSVLSLQSLPRRLTLDFRDVFSQGFAFDFVRGDVSIQAGQARTNNLQMKGVNAAVLMDGSADIQHETQDLRVVVVPEIDASTASLIATVINPAIGLGTFLAQMFLRRPLMEAATQEFHIDGTWADPKITKINRRAKPVGNAADAVNAGS